jgi:hypothetical protein
MECLPFAPTARPPQRLIGRRQAAALLLASLGATALTRTLRAAPIGPVKDFKFRVLREGSEIGSHAISFEDSGARHVVRSRIRLAVKVAFITAFRYEHDGEEVWENGQIMSLRTRTHDNGPEYAVLGNREANGFRVVGPDGPFVTAPNLLPSSAVWHPDYVRQTAIINVEQGGEMGLSTRKLESEMLPGSRSQMMAQKFRMVTPHCGGFVWYDSAMRWVRAEIEIKGEKLIYEPA